MELVSYVVRLTTTGIDKLEAHRQLYLKWRVPCLGVTIVGELDISPFHVYSMF